MKFTVRLENLRFFSRIGVYSQERCVGNEFAVSVSFAVDASGFVSEDIRSTVSYADVYLIVEEEMKREWLLLESVCASIADRISCRFPCVKDMRVKISKLAPPIPGIQGECSVEYAEDCNF